MKSSRLNLKLVYRRPVVPLKSSVGRATGWIWIGDVDVLAALGGGSCQVADGVAGNDGLDHLCPLPCGGGRGFDKLRNGDPHFFGEVNQFECIICTSGNVSRLPARYPWLRNTGFSGDFRLRKAAWSSSQAFDKVSNLAHKLQSIRFRIVLQYVKELFDLA
jgi:hypothetical protein